MNRRTILLVVDALLLAGFIVAVIGLLGESIIEAEEGTRRIASVYGSPNNVGLFLGRCIPFLVAFLVYPVDSRRRGYALFLLIVITLAVILTQSAGAIFVGVPASVAAVIWLRWRRRSLLPLAGLMIVGILALLVLASQSPRFSRIFDLSEGTNFYRIRVWQSALNIIQDHPFTGLGLDQFLYQFRGTYIMPDAWQEPDLSHPHNFVMDFWVRLGILGVILFIGMQRVFWRRMFTFYRSPQSINVLYMIAVGLMGSMVNMLTHGLIDNSVYVIDLAYVFALLMGLALRIPNISAIDEKL